MNEIFKRADVSFSQEWFRNTFDLKKGIYIVGARYVPETNSVHLSFIDTEGKSLPEHWELCINQIVDFDAIKCGHMDREIVTVFGETIKTCSVCLNCGKTLQDDFKEEVKK